MWLGFGLCHQMPERSFAAGGIQVPVCARDEGIYLGFLAALLFISFLERGGRRSSWAPPLWVTLTMIAFIGAMALDGVTSYAGLRATTNEIRLITGLMAGVAIAVFTIPLINSQLWRNPGPGKILATPLEFAGLMGVMAATYATAMWVLPHAGLLHPVIVSVAILVTFSAVVLVIVCIMPPFERRADRLRDAWLALLVAFAGALFILALAAVLKAYLLGLAGMPSGPSTG